MRNFQTILAVVVAILAVVGFESCSSAGGEYAGAEYMPDMAHSVAYEANTLGDYYYNNWNERSQATDNSGFSRRQLSLHNLPVEGTVPRGYAAALNAKDRKAFNQKLKVLRGETSLNAVSIPMNGSVPYYVPNTEDGRTYASSAAELRENPFPISDERLKSGKELYEVFCGICHGNKGDGNGWLVDEANPNVKYPAQPTNYLTDELIDSENGRYYHVIMHGKGVMGSYKDKLSYEERWNVIHYIRSLQAKKRKLAYSPYENTFKPGWAVPFVDTDEALDLNKSDLAREFKKKLNSDFKKTFLLDHVYFNTGSADLKAESKLELNILAEILRQYPDTDIRLEGYTDNVGSLEGNEALSAARATSVMNYLKAKGTDATRLSAKGYGPANPIANNATEAGRAKNRRTEFTIVE